ncbi:MAG TPA: hypothetical protein VEH00_07005 [Steroidobacteraceae bacterium]|nr:hypothetical protein [Steroidobacteraceae bacterium]
MSDGRPGRLPVPRYEVTVQGRGIALPVDGTVAIGFLRLVQLRARDPVDAEIRAVELVRSDWAASAHAGRNLGDAPYLTINRIGSLNWWHRLLGTPRGYIFFGEDGVQIPAGPAQS